MADTAAEATVASSGRGAGEGRRSRDGRPWRPELSQAVAWPLLLPLLALVGVFVIYPIVKLFADSVTQGAGLQNYVDALDSGAMRRALVSTLLSGVIVTGLAVGLGAVIAWWLRTTTSRARRTLVWIAVLIPFCMGIVIKNYVFAMILARNGVVNDALTGLGVAGEPLQLMYTRFAVIVGMLYAMLPYAVLSLYAAFSTIDPALQQAARSMGASRARAARTVVLPLGLPGILASATIVFAISIGFYVTPVLLGGKRTPFVASLIEDDIFRVFNYPRAAAASVILLAIAIALLVAGFKAVGGKRLREALS